MFSRLSATVRAPGLGMLSVTSGPAALADLLATTQKTFMSAGAARGFASTRGGNSDDNGADTPYSSTLLSGWTLHLPRNKPLLLRRKDERTLQKLLVHPPSMNVRWRDVEGMLTGGLGAEVEPAGKRRGASGAKGVKVTLNGASHVFREHAVKDPGQLRHKDEVLAIRRMLVKAGLLEKTSSPTSDHTER